MNAMMWLRLLTLSLTVLACGHHPTVMRSASTGQPSGSAAMTVEVQRFQYDPTTGRSVPAGDCTISGDTIQCDEASATLEPTEARWFHEAVADIDWTQSPFPIPERGGWRFVYVGSRGQQTVVVNDGAVAPGSPLDALVHAMQATLRHRELSAQPNRCAPDAYFDTCPAPDLQFATVCGAPQCVPQRPSGSCVSDHECTTRCAPSVTDTLRRTCT